MSDPPLPEDLATFLCCDTRGPRISNDTTTFLCFYGVEEFYDVPTVWTRTGADLYFFDALEHNEDFEATGEALHFFDALEDSSIATAYHGVQTHAVGGEPEFTLNGSVSRGEGEISSSHAADNTQPAEVISATTQGRNLGVSNSYAGAPDFSRGVNFLDSQPGAEEVFQE